MKIVTIIQARMGSTRLPGKVLADIGGLSMLARTVARAGMARYSSETVVATTTSAADDAVVEECGRIGVPVYRGSEDDVLDRYHRAAGRFDAEGVVRITSDCPLIDPGVMDETIGAFLARRPDYASNTLERRYPRGLDTEVMKADALRRAWREAAEPYQRTHVTPFIIEHPSLFRLLPVIASVDNSRLRWTVDTGEDLELVREVYRRLGEDRPFTWQDVLGLMTRDTELARLNSHIRQKSLEEG